MNVNLLEGSRMKQRENQQQPVVSYIGGIGFKSYFSTCHNTVDGRDQTHQLIGMVNIPY